MGMLVDGVGQKAALVMADIARARGGLTAFVARYTARAGAFIDALKFFAPEIEAVL